MTLVDSLDSILMLYAYAPIGRDDREGKLAIFYSDKGRTSPVISEEAALPILEEQSSSLPAEEEGSGPDKISKNLPSVRATTTPPLRDEMSSDGRPPVLQDDKDDYARQRVLAAKAATMSTLSITLTLLSIIVAFWYVMLMSHDHDTMTDIQYLAHHDHGSHRRELRGMYSRRGRPRRRWLGWELVAILG